MHISKGSLCSALTRLFHIISSAAPLPIVRCAHLRARAGHLVATATDLETWIRSTIPARGDIATCVDAGALRDAVKPINKADHETAVYLEVSPDGKTMTVTGPDSTVTLETQPLADWPVCPADAVKPARWRAEARWDARELATSLGWVLRAASHDPTRRQLTGVLLDEDCAVSTDGHRLHRVALRGLKSGPALLPGSAVRALVRVLPPTGEITATRSGDVIRFSAGTVEVFAKPMDEQYVPYRQVIPDERHTVFQATLESARLRAALARIPRTRSCGSRIMRVRVNGELVIGRYQDAAVSEIHVPLVENSHRGADYVSGLDVRYVEEAIRDAGDFLVAQFGGGLDPVVFTPRAGRTAVVMPARL